MGENNAFEENKPFKRTKVPAAVVPLLGVGAVLLGCLIAYVNRDFTGWFAYAPLSNMPSSANGAAFITQGTQIGLAVAIAGLLLLAFWVGFRLGRRTRFGPK
jgi:heme/copper-type cytochrome/quinol oxidase subunit 1